MERESMRGWVEDGKTSEVVGNVNMEGWVGWYLAAQGSHALQQSRLRGLGAALGEAMQAQQGLELGVDARLHQLAAQLGQQRHRELRVVGLGLEALVQLLERRLGHGGIGGPRELQRQRLELAAEGRLHLAEHAVHEAATQALRERGHGRALLAPGLGLAARKRGPVRALPSADAIPLCARARLGRPSTKAQQYHEHQKQRKGPHPVVSVHVPSAKARARSEDCA